MASRHLDLVLLQKLVTLTLFSGAGSYRSVWNLSAPTSRLASMAVTLVESGESFMSWRRDAGERR